MKGDIDNFGSAINKMTSIGYTIFESVTENRVKFTNPVEKKTKIWIKKHISFNEYTWREEL